MGSRCGGSYLVWMTAGGTVVACAAPEDAKLARDVVDAVNVNGTVDLRYSAGPEEDQARGASHDYQADVDLPGLSVTGDFTPTVVATRDEGLGRATSVRIRRLVRKSTGCPGSSAARWSAAVQTMSH